MKTELALITTEPILVKNPYTGRLINVAPLFDAMNQFDEGKPDSVDTLRRAITRAIRLVNLSQAPADAGKVDVNYDLYRLEDMFEAMHELK